MTANDIITLANAGFNATQIAKILEIANAPAQVPTPPAQVPTPPAQVLTQVPVPPAQVPTPPAQVLTQVPTPPAPVPTQVPVPPAQVPAQVPTNAPDYILQAIQRVDNRLNQLAIQNSQMPERQTTHDILAEIINPPREEEKK